MVRDRSFVRTAALWSAAGALLQIVIGILSGFVPLLQEDTPAVTIPRELLLAALHALLLVGLLGLWRSGAVSGGRPADRLGRIGYILAVFSRAMFVFAELTVIFDLATANVIFSVATPLQGLGMLGIGLALLPGGSWRGWHSWTPLLCGLYTFLVLLPAFVLSGGPNYPAIGGWSIMFLLFSLALYREARQARQTQLAAAH
jgi:hypothetical protein